VRHRGKDDSAPEVLQVEEARRRVGEAVDVANVPVLRSQLDAATTATTAEDLWDDQQVFNMPVCWQAPAIRLQETACHHDSLLRMGTVAV